MRLDRIPQFALESHFASQIEGNLLFHLVSVVDAAIQWKNPSKTWKFSEQAAYLSQRRVGQLTNAVLGELNGSFIKDFGGTMAELLDNRHRTQGGTLLDPVDSAIGVAYGIRNEWAHGVPAADVIWRRFNEIKQRAFDVLFLTVDFL
jgi:hypothetical protein